MAGALTTSGDRSREPLLLQVQPIQCGSLWSGRLNGFENNEFYLLNLNVEPSGPVWLWLGRQSRRVRLWLRCSGGLDVNICGAHRIEQLGAITRPACIAFLTRDWPTPGHVSKLLSVRPGVLLRLY